MIEARCPSCRAAVRLNSDPVIGQRVTCLKCHTELEVVWLYPVDLDWVDETHSLLEADINKKVLKED